MKKCLKKLLIIVLAVVCAGSIHISASAQDDNAPNNWGGIQDLIDQLINGLTPGATTTNPTPETTTVDSNTTTTDNNIANTVTGVVTTVPPTNYTTVPNNVENNQGGNNTLSPGQLTTVPLVTTEPHTEEAISNDSLADLLEQDSAAIIIQAPTETFTLNAGLVVNNGQREENFTWQQAALIAAAVLFVILAALVAALIVQRNKRVKEEEEERRRINNMASSSSSSGPVPVEVMTPERIAELLGSAPNTNRGTYYNAPSAQPSFDINSMSGEESAAAIKAAILMNQLSHSYSDPLIRKYTEEPVTFSPVSKVNLEDGVTGAQILEATDSMLFDITGNEKYASDISGIKVPDEDIESILNSTETKICPECKSPVSSSDIFCHSCGAYVG